MEFFEFIRIRCIQEKKEYPNFEDVTFILPLERSYREFIAKNGKVIQTVYPPDVNLALNIIVMKFWLLLIGKSTV